MRKLITTFAASAAALVMAAGPASAAVDYDPATGGFAGKGDMAAALGIHEKNLADSYSLTYVETVDYDVPCIKENKGTIIRQTFDRASEVTATVTGEARKNKQLVITGYNLGPATNSVESGNPSCPGGFEANGEPIEVGSTGGQLFVNGVLLPITG